MILYYITYCKLSERSRGLFEVFIPTLFWGGRGWGGGINMFTFSLKWSAPSTTTNITV